MSRGGRTTAVWGIRAGIVLLVALAWEWYGRADGEVFIPAFSSVLSALWEHTLDGTIAEAMWLSNQSMLIGFPLSVVLGLGIGLVLGRRRLVDRTFSYLFDLMMVVPMIAVVPVVIVALGLSLTARVAVVMLFALPVVVLNARAAVRVVDHELIEMAGAFGADRRQVWQTVVLPAALGPIFTGLRIGLSRAVSGMIVVELTLIPAGLGGLLVTYRSQFAGASLYAVTLAVLIEGAVLIGLAHLAERRLLNRMRGGGV
ncbi:ABC transporter permease [Rhizohabitans arisaemae]|uniref:ABC transporter permease n=1 Tax=Rhizohabitans arisaemae TaxID=2720610 RepID=UPI0024B1A7CB|nr:ABC transporter permease subunit [Rhizohabitans arisaemae]